uniref:Marker of proliferation Ki-67 n=1 Tax=Oryzias latipes TaxID=8090 RepID=H2LHJ7_ORYLA
MPLHGKIVVIKRSGVDGTEFPLTASCLFGRKPDCDIRIQLPQVSKEHCRIDLNENKEVILTNLSTANPTRVNGEVLAQSERLKHGDTITIWKKLYLKCDSQTFFLSKQSAFIGSHLKDGAHHDNIQRSLEKTLEMESTEASQEQTKNDSPFSDLYHMIKKSLEIKTPCKSSASQAQTPSSKFCTPNPASVRKSTNKPATPTPENDQPKGSETPQTAKKQAKTIRVPAGDEPRMEEPNASSEGPSQKRRSSGTSQKFTAMEIIEQVSASCFYGQVQCLKCRSTLSRMSNCNIQVSFSFSVKAAPKKRKSGELRKDQLSPQKKKRVSFGGQLSPELFDKRLPPNSPLRKGATPRRSLMVFRPKSTLLRRASVIGLIKQSPAKARTPSPKKPKAGKSASPKAASPAQKSPKSRSASPKAASPAQKSPKSKSVLPKSPTSAQKSPKSRSASPKAASPAQKSPKSKSVLPKSPTSAQKSPKSRSASPKAASPAQKSPKSRSASPKSASPAQKSPKSRSASPKAASPAQKSPKSKSVLPKSPTSAQKSPKSRSASPKAASPAQKSPKSRSASPKAASPAQKSPKSRSASPKAASPAQKSPKSRSASPKAKSMGGASPKTPLNSGVQTQTLQGRFSVSRISTPSPTAEAKPVKEPLVTPKIPIKRKSMKSSAQKTPRSAKSAAKMLQRRSGASRISMKGLVPKGHVSTGHADSPATIVVGRAHKKHVVVGAAPRVVTNTVLIKKRMKMDEDLTGISEMFQTPVAEKKRRSLTNDPEVVKTPGGSLSASVMSTPEESGEMIVSPLSVASAIKNRRYNSEAVQRLLDGEESSFAADDLTVNTESTNQNKDGKTAAAITPKQNAPKPEGLTGVKRIVKTPKQKTEPLEDLRGKILKTPKQKPEQRECLTGVKRIMKTPKHKAEPLEDLRGKILKTPKQKTEQQECLTGVKRIMKTPKHKAEPLEDLRGNLLKTPKQKPEQQECLTGVRRIFKTPQQEAEPVEDLREKLSKTPKDMEMLDVSLDGVEELLKTPANDEAKNPQTMSAPEPPEEPAPVLPVRGRRGKKTEATASSAVRPTRGRNAKISGEESAPQVSKAANRRETGRNAKHEEKGEQVTEDTVTAENQELEHQGTSAMISRAKRAKGVQNEAPVRAKRGRNAKHEDEEVDRVSQDVTDCQQASVEEKTNKSEEIVALHQEEPAAVEALTTKPRRGGRKAKQDAPAASTEVQEPLRVPTEKPVRGRRGKPVPEDAVTAENQELEPEHQETEERIGKPSRAVAPGRAKRGRNAKHEDEEVDKVLQDVTNFQQASVEELTNKKAKQDAPAASTEVQEPLCVSTEKPVRGRRGRQVPGDTVTAESQNLEPEHQETTEKVGRAKRTKVVQNEVPVRAKRGRNAKHEEKEVDKVSQDVTNSQQASVEERPKEIVVPQQEEPAKPRRGGRKAKQDAESVAAAPSTEVQEPLRVSTDKPVRGRRGKRVPEDAVTAESLELEPEHQETTEKVCKSSRTKREKAAQNEVAKATPVKRAQRGAAPAGETAEQLTLSVPEPAPGVAAPKAKRGRRVAAKQSPEEVSSEQTSPAEEEGKPVVEESKKPSRFVSWKADLEICDIPKALPVKAARGRKSKLNAHNENKNVSDADAAKGEELSGDAVQTVPAKRSRRGVHGGDVAAASTSKSGLKENEPQPKTRRGRAAKK